MPKIMIDLRQGCNGHQHGRESSYFAYRLLRIIVEIVRRPDASKGFVLLPKRWRVEQAFGAGRFCRRLLADHETLPRVSEAMIQLSSIMRSIHMLAT